MHETEWQMIHEFSYPSEIGNERQAGEDVARVAKAFLPPERLAPLQTAVSEGALNAIEHGNRANPNILVHIQLMVNPTQVAVRITDEGGNQPIPENTAPDLDKKLAGLESPRGWGLFLIRNMVDQMNIQTEGQRHTLELILNRQGE
jgi:anti-sigma regulatory factor (Ser/Thr protein kinase)